MFELTKLLCLIEKNPVSAEGRHKLTKAQHDCNGGSLMDPVFLFCFYCYTLNSKHSAMFVIWKIKSSQGKI